MFTSLLVFENGELKREPVEITYRTLTYYFDDTIAKIVAEPKTPTAPVIPTPDAAEVRNQQVLNPEVATLSVQSSPLTGEPPPLLKRLEPEGAASVFASRKEAEIVTENVAAPEPASAPVPARVESTAETSAGKDQNLANELYLAGRNRFESGDVPGAIDSYLQSIKLEPGSAEVHLNLGHAYLKLQKDREAVKAFKESVKLNSKLVESHYGLGFANFRMGRFRDAADAFKKATVLEPRMAKAHYGLSLAYQELGMTSALMEEYRILETLDKSLAKKLAQTFPQFNFSCRLVRGCP